MIINTGSDNDFGNRILKNREEGRRLILPDCDGHPSVVIDVLARNSMQNLTATTPKFSNSTSILKEHMKELLPQVLLLS